jgi:histone H3/H4
MTCQNPLVLIIIVVATVQKIVTEILPPSSGLAFGKDARDLLIECCVEFITLISSEANEISEKESKKTIACEHITKALEQLGFGDYIQDIMEVASEHKEQLKVCPPASSRGFLTNNGTGTREEGQQARAERIVHRTASCDAGGGFSGCSSTTWIISGLLHAFLWLHRS